MKRFITLAMTAILTLALLTACGGAPSGGSAGETETVDLTAFYDSLNEQYQWGEQYFVDLDDELLAATYPGIESYTFPQKIAKMPQITAAVNEFVFLECESAEDAKAVAEILRQRIEDQANGGAWYPASMEAWENAQVLEHGKYVTLIAAGENQADIEAAWNQQFA